MRRLRSRSPTPASPNRWPLRSCTESPRDSARTFRSSFTTATRLATGDGTTLEPVELPHGLPRGARPPRLGVEGVDRGRLPPIRRARRCARLRRAAGRPARRPSAVSRRRTISLVWRETTSSPRPWPSSSRSWAPSAQMSPARARWSMASSSTTPTPSMPLRPCVEPGGHGSYGRCSPASTAGWQDDRRMVDVTRSSPPGRELAARGRDARATAMLDASVSLSRREAHARREAVPRPPPGWKRPRRARSCIRTHEIVASTI